MEKTNLSRGRMKIVALLPVLGILVLSGCTIPQMAATSGIVYATKDDHSSAPADTQSQIPEHESWCYRTMGNTQCYTKAQPVLASRLVNVEPQNRYPLTPEEYQDELAGKRQGFASAKPETLGYPPTQDSETFFEKYFGL